MLRACDSEEDSVDRLIGPADERERAVPRRESEQSREELTVSLGRVHLPKFDDLGVIDYDADERTVTYHRTPGLESCVRYVETPGLG